MISDPEWVNHGLRAYLESIVSRAGRRGSIFSRCISRFEGRRPGIDLYATPVVEADLVLASRRSEAIPDRSWVNWRPSILGGGDEIIVTGFGRRGLFIVVWDMRWERAISLATSEDVDWA